MGPTGGWRIRGKSGHNKSAWVWVWVEAQRHDGIYGDNALYIDMQEQGKEWKVVRTAWSDPCGY